MTYWNYRVLMRHDTIEGEIYEIHEVYYDENGDISMWTEHPAELSEGSVEDLRDTLKHMLDALRKPPLREVLQDGKEQLVPLE
ncbi:hypothetical protein [Pseudomonas sp. NBRC 100443]|uniref:hypothetical protein n=1 Tax=Pseudomonas sp. NBRC 100443 TaxID=1113665 RepID=UPI002556794A|nr:hypothetical protein [Pseudomonas sp. NBRC 100443]